MILIVRNIGINEIKKIAILLGRDFKDIEEKQKAKGVNVKSEKDLGAEIENKVKEEKDKQTKKK